MTDPSPLWCHSDAPHSPHSARNEFGGTNTCTGHPEPADEAAAALAELTYVVPGHNHLSDANRKLGIHAARAVLKSLQKPTEEAIIDQWWTSCDDEWAVPESVMVQFARDVLARWGTPKKIPNEEA